MLSKLTGLDCTYYNKIGCGLRQPLITLVKIARALDKSPHEAVVAVDGHWQRSWQRSEF